MRIFALVVGAMVGFWLISLALDRRKPNFEASRPDPATRQDAQLPGMRSAPESELMTDACRVLELGQPFTEQELLAAYQKQISQYHPDKVRDLGPELREVADRKTKEINAALDVLQGHTR
ncbi:J domain-containing protein [Cupriavidus pampae]|jgi:DnaJ like chaperone protein|uniref:Co-chaperone protein DjlA n=1 Tax=Cupriavidus pampae TaxID=659251 RepID=A0ABM8WI01_9BURK|nr:DnaJ domain-containing protein [Cupriavidus pampae]CAG9166735.1 Co-chaperone protein DjlA [Cupriavidus pampae]